MPDPEPRVPPTDDRLADPDAEGLLVEEHAVLPDDERVVPEDANEFLPDPDPDDV
jgi:hypothetical protein